jgi:DNA-binding transcriptional ArsR family regulator
MAVTAEEKEGLVFRALSDSSRRKILDLLVKDPGINISDLCDHFPTSRFAIMKHLNILEDAGLIKRERDGNTRRIFINPEPIKLILNRSKAWT